MRDMGGPRQSNGFDCGVFCCQTANYITLGLTPEYSQSDIPFLRELMIDQLMGLSLKEDGSEFPREVL